MSLYPVYMHCSMYPECTVEDDDVYREPCLGHFFHVILFVLINVFGKEHRSFTSDVKNDKYIHLNHMWLNSSILILFKW